MTSISSSSSDGSFSSLSRVQNVIQRDASAGAITATDQTALTSALGDIAAQLSGTGNSSSATAAPSATSAPASMKDRVDSLIDNEVSSGKLTSDQAAELKKAFAQAHAHMHGAHGHHGGVEGLLAAVTGSSASDGTSSADTAASGTTATNPLGTAASTAAGALEAFITQFKSALGSSGLYGATGTGIGTGSSGGTSLLVNAVG